MSAAITVTHRHGDRVIVEAGGVPLMSYVYKPDPVAYQWCCRALGTEPEHILFIDDRAENLETAARLGMRTHQFTGLDQAARATGVGP